MKTYCFIGTDKNAGKTTALKFIYQKMCKDSSPSSICLTSIGINGEESDQYDGRGKPPVRLQEDSYFVTKGDHLKMHTGKYATIAIFANPEFTGNYILGRCLCSLPVILEGPNTGHEVLAMKESIKSLLKISALLIDGSVDRQFLATPRISDIFYFSVLFSDRKQQQNKTRDFLYSLSLPPCEEKVRKVIEDKKDDTTKSLLFGEGGKLIYRGKTIPFSDRKLQAKCAEMHESHCVLYLQGGLTSTLYEVLAPFTRLHIVLDNFTLYLNVSTKPGKRQKFRPKITLLSPVNVQTIFIREETEFARDLLPANVQIINLFRKEYHENRV